MRRPIKTKSVHGATDPFALEGHPNKQPKLDRNYERRLDVLC